MVNFWMLLKYSFLNILHANPKKNWGRWIHLLRCIFLIKHKLSHVLLGHFLNLLLKSILEYINWLKIDIRGDYFNKQGGRTPTLYLILSRFGSHWKVLSNSTALCHLWCNSSDLAARWGRDYRGQEWKQEGCFQGHHGDRSKKWK